ncbi:MAG: 5'/3'-nucleotidase SurE [Phycisphaerae bacterium]|nr:5'/3'-nucleotidase SurE [Phycisphaerae bacterium]
MRILLTNDDGIFAPGLLAMYNALSTDAHVDVVAPQAVHSGGSHSITIRHPLLWQRANVGGQFHGAAVEGTPADCIKLAINALLSERPDLVVSGINAGQNTGIHVLYSGTVAAAIEAAIYGFPAFAVSLQVHHDMDFGGAARVAKQIIDRIVQHGLHPRQVFNINIPESKPGWPRGVRVAPQSIRPIAERLEKRTDPNDREYYWLNGDFANLDDDDETDRLALREGYVCVTPLQFNLTDKAALDNMADWPWPNLA